MLSPDQQILDLVKQSLKDVGETYEEAHLPCPPEGKLAGKTILQVDDELLMLQTFIPYLASASAKKAIGILHKGEPPDEIVAKVIERTPDIVLLDYCLADQINGSSLVAPIRKALPDALIIGFSTGAYYEQLFTQAGADGFLIKKTYEVARLPSQLASLIY